MAHVPTFLEWKKEIGLLVLEDRFVKYEHLLFKMYEKCVSLTYAHMYSQQTASRWFYSH